MTGFVSKRQAAQGKLNDDTQVYAGRKRGSIALARQLCYEIAGATSEDDDISGRDYGSVNVAEILSAEVVRLQAALAKPVLQDIEQYRLQMAAICTAAIGYWEEDDGIHQDYDTLAFRDVAALYAKYDELYRAHPPQRTWVGLTEWEREAIAHACGAMGAEWLVFVEAVEKALKEKNR